MNSFSDILLGIYGILSGFEFNESKVLPLIHVLGIHHRIPNKIQKKKTQKLQ